MKGILLTLLTLLLPAIGIHAQELVVKSFTQSQLELIRNQDQRTDGNGQPCAVVKVQLSGDRVDRLEGSFVGDVTDRGTEAWTYWTEGTKYLKVYFKNHLPITVRVPDYDISSLEGNMVYVLVLQAPLLESKFHLGMRGGVNYSFPSFDKKIGDNYSDMLSFHIGPTVDYRLSRNFALQGALLLSGKGYTNENHFYNYDKHATGYYLDIPVEVAYIPIATDGLQLRLFAGPYAAIGLFGNTKSEKFNYFDYGFFEDYTNADLGIHDGNSRFDFGLSAGVAAIIARHFSVTASYQHGLASDYKNRCLMGSLGYIF